MEVLEAGAIFNVRNLEFIWCTDYAEDIFRSLKEIEKRRRQISYKTLQLGDRAALVALIKIAAETHSLNRTAVHLAVYLLDCVLDFYTIEKRKLKIIALTSLLLACKMEEIDRKIPKICKLNSLVDDIYTKHEFSVVEALIINFFDWYILFPTAATFVESCAHKVVRLEDFQKHQMNSRLKIYDNPNQMFAASNCLVFDFLDVTLHDRRFVCHKPSLVAAACLAGVRRVMDCEPVWTEHLEDLTGYREEEISEYVNALIALKSILDNVRDDAKKKDTPDSGFMSDCKSESQSESESESEMQDIEVCSSSSNENIDYYLDAKRRRLNS